MNLDLEALKAAALAAGGGRWTATDGVVWFDDGDSAMIADPAHATPPVFSACDNLGAWPDLITSEGVATFAALACPAAVLALIDRVTDEHAANVMLIEENDRLQAKVDELERDLRLLERTTGVLIPRGQTMCREDYPALYATLGGSAKRHATGDFKLPDLKGRFLATPDTERSEPDCWKCHRAMVAKGTLPAPRMILCPVCGNKRCPKASDHDLPCTGSNEPGQPGSVY